MRGRLLRHGAYRGHRLDEQKTSAHGQLKLRSYENDTRTSGLSSES